MLINLFKQFIKKSFNIIGLDIVRKSKNPACSLLGLKNLPIKTIIDVGANKGQFARIATNVFPEAHIYCFEPLPRPYQKLQQWAKRQRKGEISTFNLALGNKEGFLEIFSHVEHNPSSSFLKTTNLCESLYPFTQNQVSISVKLTTLDSWINRFPNPLAPEMLIKLDVQGYEDRVIQGGVKTFSIAKACILEVCLDQLYKDQATFKVIFPLLNDLGYSYVGNLNQTYADDGHVIYIDAVFMKQHNKVKLN